MVVLAPADATGTRVCRPGYAASEYGSGRASSRVSSGRAVDSVNGIELGVSGTNGGLGP